MRNHKGQSGERRSLAFVALQLLFRVSFFPTSIGFRKPSKETEELQAARQVVRSKPKESPPTTPRNAPKFFLAILCSPCLGGERERTLWGGEKKDQPLSSFYFGECPWKRNNFCKCILFEGYMRRLRSTSLLFPPPPKKKILWGKAMKLFYFRVVFFSLSLSLSLSPSCISLSVGIWQMTAVEGREEEKEEERVVVVFWCSWLI